MHNHLPLLARFGTISRLSRLQLNLMLGEMQALCTPHPIKEVLVVGAARRVAHDSHGASYLRLLYDCFIVTVELLGMGRDRHIIYALSCDLILAKLRVLSSDIERLPALLLLQSGTISDHFVRKLGSMGLLAGASVLRSTPMVHHRQNFL